MSQTILIETSEDLKKIYTINLNTFVGTDVINRQNAEDTLALLKILPQVALVITRVRVGNEETALIIHNYIKAQNLSTSMIVIGECPPIAGQVLCLLDPVNWELLVNQAANCLGINLQYPEKQKKSEYMPVATYYFYDIQRSPCDVFIRLKKGPAEFQFVKRIHSKDSFDKQVITKYEEQGLKEFYIPEDYIQYFTTFVTNNLVQKLERSDLTLEDRIISTSNGHEIVRDRIQQMELDAVCIELSDAAVHSMVKSVKDSPEIVNLLKFLFSNKVSYAYQHSHLLSLMCHYICSRQNWYKPEHLETLSFAAFFSDVTLKSQIQMRIGSEKDLEHAQLTEEEKNQVMNHARDAVTILENHPEANDVVKTVILQSHGMHGGVGISENPREDIHALSKVFIIADNFVKILLNPDMPTTKKDIIPLLYERFTNPSFQMIIKSLEQKFE